MDDFWGAINQCVKISRRARGVHAFLNLPVGWLLNLLAFWGNGRWHSECLWFLVKVYPIKTATAIQLVFILAACCARGQGSFVFDQQVTASDSSAGSVLASSVQGTQPTGQSFIPSLSSVGFIRLFLFDAVFPNPQGMTMFVNLWSGSISNGTLLASTDSIILPPGFDSITNFVFAIPVRVMPGSIYYFQPYVQSGDIVDMGIVSGSSGYANGTAIYGGTPNAAQDLWFREGIVATPEPSGALLALFGMAGIYFHRRRNY